MKMEKSCVNKHSQLGFTLIELLTVVVIIGVLAAIALPSYQEYVIRNAELEAQAQMGDLQLQLERWRTTAMSYRGFYPLAANTSSTSTKSNYQYQDAANTKIYVPLGSNENNYRYEITLLDGADYESLSPAPSTTVTLGRSWVMLATPNTSGTVGKRARVFLQRSEGLKCATKSGAPATDLSIKRSDCTGANLETW